RGLTARRREGMNLDSALQTFIVEARELLQDMEAALLRLENEAADSETINAIFRAAHTIKGSAGLFGLDGVVAFTHVVESVRDRPGRAGRGGRVRQWGGECGRPGAGRRIADGRRAGGAVSGELRPDQCPGGPGGRGRWRRGPPGRRQRRADGAPQPLPGGGAR